MALPFEIEAEMIIDKIIDNSTRRFRLGLPAVLAGAWVFLTIAACAVADTSEYRPPSGKDASADARGGSGGMGGNGLSAGGSAANVANAGSVISVGGSGGSGDLADAAIDVAMEAAPPPIVCPPAAMEGTGKGLRGEYFAKQDLSESKAVRLDPVVSFDWDQRAADGAAPADRFSVRWTGQVQPRFTGMYTFFANADDGIRLWVGDVNGATVLDDFTEHPGRESSGMIALVAGQKYDIKVEYFDSQGPAKVQLEWSSDCQGREVVPTSQLYPPAVTCGTPMTGTGTGLKGEYFDNMDLTSLVATHATENIDYNWPTGMLPDPAVQEGTNSVRWTGQVQAKLTGPMTFYTMADDGVRLYIDDELMVDHWSDHGTAEDAGTVNMTAGQKYNLRLEYYENGGGGQIKLQWGSLCMPRETIASTQLYPTYTGVVCAPPTNGTGTGLKGAYYNAPDFTDLKVTHAAEAVDSDFGGNAPDPSVGADMFSIRWTGQVQARFSGKTKFRTLSDDGVRLWVGGNMVIDNFDMDHGTTEDTATVDLVAGQKYDIRVDYRENGGSAVIKLLWSGPCQATEVIPATQLYPGL
jgi:hypothetical protein